MRRSQFGEMDTGHGQVGFFEFNKSGAEQVAEPDFAVFAAPTASWHPVEDLAVDKPAVFVGYYGEILECLFEQFAVSVCQWTNAAHCYVANDSNQPFFVTMFFFYSHKGQTC